MSYYATFVPTEEAMEKYNPANRRLYGHYSDPLENKLAIKVMVMTGERDKTKELMQCVKDDIFKFTLLLKMIEDELIKDENDYAYNTWKNDEDHTLWYCGWKYAKNEPDITSKEVYEYVISQLITLKYCVKTDDYFKEDGNFHDKAKEVSDILEYFEDEMRDIRVFEIMNELEEFRTGEDLESSAFSNDKKADEIVDEPDKWITPPDINEDDMLYMMPDRENSEKEIEEKKDE